MHACLGLTCHLHFWQNDRRLLRVTAVARGGTDAVKKRSQHRKLNLEKKILPPLQPGHELATFRSRVLRSSSKLSRLFLQLQTAGAIQISLARITSAVAHSPVISLRYTLIYVLHTKHFFHNTDKTTKHVKNRSCFHSSINCT